MEHRGLVHLLCVLGVFHEGLTALIQTEQDVTTAVGDEACLSCQLLKSKEILQITWQKVLPEGEDNVATFNKYFGQRVNADFQGKVEIKNNGVQNCSIVIKNVTEEDEGCYRCVFNTYPDGAFIGNTCLRVYMRVLSAAQKQEVRIIPAEVKQSAEGSSSITIIIIVFSVVAVGCVAVIITVLLIRKPWNSLSLRDPEGRKTPKKPNKNTEERNQTPLMQKVNELIRRMTPGKKKESDSPKVSSSPTGANTQPSEMKTPSAQHEIEQVRLRMSTGRKEEKASSKVSTSKKGINRQLF
ncbi:T-cell immunoreceptor with Ig and ITIM domains-like [Acanthopagrus latus]|uniref:T-cell immunoreceptor with Ig and ITIM domains-like n=1 Tax=Acanthopagrus latus TaxID=8177 RepID=UPI00187CF08B|nr:T-cell immunoreceptor with Ig and ITIM domains-like [Acanthopagrus latus]